MAKASDKRIASSNETALHNLQLGLLIVNMLAPALRFFFSLITSRRAMPSKKIMVLHIVTLATSLFIYRWFKTLATPRLTDRGGVKAGEDLGGKGVIELGWDIVYMAWICTLGSAIFGDWVWWFILLVPAFGAYKAFSILRPILSMFLPGIFGPKAPRDPAAVRAGAGAGAGAGANGEPAESKRQAKLRARMEKGDRRVQQREVGR